MSYEQINKYEQREKKKEAKKKREILHHKNNYIYLTSCTKNGVHYSTTRILNCNWGIKNISIVPTVTQGTVSTNVYSIFKCTSTNTNSLPIKSKFTIQITSRTNAE